MSMAFLVVGVVALSATTSDTSGGMVSASTTIGRYGYNGADGTNVEGTLGLTVYPGSSIVDDGEPLALQPFLQRPNELSVAVHGRRFWWDGGQNSRGQAGISTSLGGRIGPMWLGGSLLFESIGGDDTSVLGQTLSSFGIDSTLRVLQPGVDVGARLGPVQLDVSYALQLLDGPRSEPARSSLAIGLRAVIEKTALALRGYSFERGGGGVSGEVELFLSPNVGVSGGGQIEDGAPYVDSNRRYRRQGGHVGLGIWPNNRFRISAAVRRRKECPEGESTDRNENSGTIGLGWRFP
jgi:hypothetical protein